MTANRKLLETRAHYIEKLQYAARDAAPVHIEPALRAADGALALDGKLLLPYRADLVPKSGGSSIRVDSTLRVMFESWEHEVGSTRITVAPFIWDYVAVTLRGVAIDAEWEPLRKWFLGWFDTEDENSLNPEGLYGVVHFMSDPEPIAEGSKKFMIDLGSAPIEGFESLLSALAGLRPSLIEVT